MNDKVVKSLIAIISFIVGGAIGIYKTTLDYESKLETMQVEFRLEVRNLSDKIIDLKSIIQNRVLTKSGE
jgi:hypothetical protein